MNHINHTNTYLSWDANQCIRVFIEPQLEGDDNTLEIAFLTLTLDVSCNLQQRKIY